MQMLDLSFNVCILTCMVVKGVSQTSAKSRRGASFLSKPENPITTIIGKPHALNIIFYEK